MIISIVKFYIFLQIKKLPSYIDSNFIILIIRNLISLSAGRITPIIYTKAKPYFKSLIKFIILLINTIF